MFAIVTTVERARALRSLLEHQAPGYDERGQHVLALIGDLDRALTTYRPAGPPDGGGAEPSETPAKAS